MPAKKRKIKFHIPIVLIVIVTLVSLVRLSHPDEIQGVGIIRISPRISFNPSPTPTLSAAPARPYLSDDPAIVYNPSSSWQKRFLVNNQQYVMETDQKNATARLFFRGNSAAVTFRKGPDAGNASIIIDGSTIEKVKLYQATEALVIYGPYHLRDGLHTIVISVEKEKKDNSLGYMVGLYKIRISNPIVPTPDYRITPIPTIDPEINSLMQQQNEILKNIYLQNGQMGSFAQQGAEISRRILNILNRN